MEILGKILGNSARVKIMRLFLQNKSKGFTNVDISKRSHVTLPVVRRELRLLSYTNFIKKRSPSSAEWFFNSYFKYGSAFEELLVRSENLKNDVILNIFRKVGQVKLVVISGVFIRNKDSRVDLLLVGNKLKKGKIEKGIRKLEAELGVELLYAIFDTEEFLYRLSMYDKLVRDILDFPHEVLLNSKELSTQALKRE